MVRMKLSLMQAKIGEKIRVIFWLVSILPFLVSVFIISKYHTYLKIGKAEIIFFLALAAVFILNGFFILIKLRRRILKVMRDIIQGVNRLGSQDLQHEFRIEGDDELSELGASLNRLIERLRQTKTLDKSALGKNVSRRFILGFTQVCSLLLGEHKEKVVPAVLKELMTDGDIEIAHFLKADKQGFIEERSRNKMGEVILGVDVLPSEKLFGYLSTLSVPLKIDDQKSTGEDIIPLFKEKFKMANLLLQPVLLNQETVAILVVGNNQAGFVWDEQDILWLQSQASLLAMAFCYYNLQQQLKKLEIRDSATGLYNETFILSRLQEEIKRAIISQRQCGLIFLDVDNFEKIRSRCDSENIKSILRKIGILLSDSVGEIDCVGRLGDDEFVIILPEKNKRKTLDIAEQIRKKIEFAFSEEPDAFLRLTISGGISENPVDGVTAEELLSKAKRLLAEAKAEGKNKIKF